MAPKEEIKQEEQESGGSNPTGREERPATTLKLWTIRLHSTGIYLQGYKASNGLILKKRTAIITRRVDSTTLETHSGSLYKLQGQMDKDLAAVARVPADLVKQFANGFPDNWQKLARKRSEKGPEMKMEKEEKDITTFKLWTIQVQTAGVILFGYKTERGSLTTVSTSTIFRRISSTQVQTYAGHIYRLAAQMDEDLADGAGIPVGLAALFSDGFPEDWHETVVEWRENCPEMVISEAAGRSDERKSEKDKKREAKMDRFYRRLDVIYGLREPEDPDSQRLHYSDSDSDKDDGEIDLG